MNLLEALYIIDSYGLEIVPPKKRQTKRGKRAEMVAEAMGETSFTGVGDTLVLNIPGTAKPKKKKRRKKKNYFITDADLKQIKKLRKEGLSARKIAKRIGCSDSTISNY